MFGSAFSPAHFLPLVGIAFILTLRGDDEAAKANARWAALATTLITFALSLVVYARLDLSSSAFQLVEEKHWFGGGLVYKLGLDGLSAPFVVLTTFLMPFCILASWQSIQNRVKEIYDRLPRAGDADGRRVLRARSCPLLSVLRGRLIPMFLIIGIWGGKRRVYAAFKFFLYTLLGSLLMLVAILAMYTYAHTDGYHRPAEDRFPGLDAEMAVARLLCVLRGEDADVAGSHLAAGCAC